jgi:hypothetical protein
MSDFEETRSSLSLEDSDPFYAGGLFAFENTEDVKKVFKRTLEFNDRFYSTRDGYVKSITDELFFAAALKESTGIIRQMGGGFNHCSMGDDHMPLTLFGEELYGKNPYETIFTPVTALHCDIARRDPSTAYVGKLKDKVRSTFYM